MKAMTRGILGKSSILLVIAMLVSLIAPGYAAEKTSNNSIVISSFTDKSGTINLNAGKGEGVRVGAKGIVQRDGKQIAEYTVNKVNWGWSSISISNLVDGYTVKPGDSAPITGRLDRPSSVKKKSNAIWAIVAVVAAILLFSKHGGSKSVSADKIALTAKKTSNPDSVSVDITANIKDAAGIAVPDQSVVTFSTTAGVVTPARALTASGIATTTLTKNSSDAAPTATVTVTSLGKTSTIEISFASSIDLSASPTTIQTVGSGGPVTESTITAICHDAAGNLATSGTVQFQAKLGTIPASAVMGADGKATVIFSSTTPGLAEIAAKWLESTATTNVTVTAGAPYSVAVSSSGTSLACDGNSSVSVTATVKDIGGNNVTDGTVVNFAVVPDGSGGGNGTITAQAATVSGVATAHLFSRDSNGATSTAGTCTLKVQVLKANQPSTVPAPASDLTNQTTTIRFISQGVASITLAAAQTNIRGLDKIGNTTTITATVKNANNDAVPDGTVVAFSATHGDINNSSTTVNGRATATLTSNTTIGGWNGNVDVTAIAGGITKTVTGLVIFSGAPSLPNCTATITPSPATLPTVGGRATIQVIAKDINGNPVADGTSVIATPSKGTITPAGSATTISGNIIFSLNTGDALTPTAAGAGQVSIMIDPGANQVLLTVPYTVGP